MQRTNKPAFMVLVALCAVGIAISIVLARRSLGQNASGNGAIARQQAGKPATANSSRFAVLSENSSARDGALENHEPGSVASAKLAKTDSIQRQRLEKGDGLPSHEALVYFRANALGQNYGKLAVAAVNDLEKINYSSGLTCERVHFSAGAGVCLAADRGVFTSYYAVKFDERMQPGWKIKLNGAPSRVRVSPTGRLAAVTVFLPGSSHSYSAGTLSTQTTLIDVASGAVLTDLEQFAVTRDGQPFKSPDFNFWGVTFTKDENRFYSTLWSNDQTFLVEANLAERTAKVIHNGVECPSLSPDNRRIAFKKRLTQSPPYTWRIALLDLDSGAETMLGETRNVDDQVEWFDNQHILYAISAGSPDQSSASTNIWVLPTSADGTAQLMLQGAASPAIVASGKNVKANHSALMKR